MGAYKRDVVVVTMFMGCLFCMGAYYPDFTQFPLPPVIGELRSVFYTPEKAYPQGRIVNP